MRLWVLLTVTLILSACGTGYAPVSDQSLGLQRPIIGAGEYRVRSGDTLIGIAFRLGIDHRRLAAINGIKDKDLIYAGQILKTQGTPVTNTSPTPSKAVANRLPTKNTASKKTIAPVVTNFSWGWPHSGKILAKYSSKEGGNKGLDISGKLGDAVKAAAPGQVVYAGSGLLGYGNLVIISHNQEFLSAYAHNSRILVKENQQVKAGQVIAELGSSGATVPMLHFEIRKDGKPVDPLRYLPNR